jgi:hypothetical protein
MDAQSKEVLLAILDFNTQLYANDVKILNTIDILKSYGLDGDNNNSFFETIKNYVISTILDEGKVTFIKDIMARIDIENRKYLGSLAEASYLDTTKKAEFLLLIQRDHIFPISTEEYDYYKVLVNRIAPTKDAELIQAVKDKILAI